MTTNSQSNGVPVLDHTPTEQVMRHPQVIAWTVVLTSFILFCVLCTAGTFAAYWFLFDSTVALKNTLIVSRGVVTVITPENTGYTVTDKAQIASGSTLQVGPDAQGYMAFEDGYTGQIVGKVFLLANSTVKFADASRPQFEWSKQRYIMLFTDAAGRFSVDISEQLSRTVALHIQSPVGVARMEGSGSYDVLAADPTLTLYTRNGMGFVYISPDNAKLVPPAAQGIVTHGTTEINVVQSPVLMLNKQEIGPPQPTFGTADSDAASLSTKLPINWGCSNTRANQNEIDGRWERRLIDQQMALYIVRRDAQQLDHASTDCVYYFPELHTDQYEALSILLKMKISYQDVTTCGVVGSECPIMLELKYVDKNGTEQYWRQGFYADRPPSDNSVPRCDTCPRDHEQIKRNAWYIYDTGDLKQQFPADRAIDYIIYIKVYASGHQYEVALSDVMVLGRKATQASTTS